MFFKKNPHKVLKKEFMFLKENGFLLTEFRCGCEYELCYKLNDIQIHLNMYMGTDTKYMSDLWLDIILNVKGQESNLLKSNGIFNENILKQLSNNLNSKNIYEKIEIYSAFIKEHLVEIIKR